LAVKVLPLFEGEEDQTAEIMKEIDVMKECKHENIVKYYGSFLKDQKLYVAMEYCHAGALNEIYVDLGEPFTEKQIAYVMRESLKGLQYLHSKGIIHRDIKGGNILLDKNAKVKLVDFGTCGRIDAKNRKRYSFVGTPYWMAPEVIDNGTMRVPYDETSDIWSLAVTAIECAECDPPWAQMHPMRALFVIPAAPPPKLTDQGAWSGEFHDFLSTCLVKDPKQRPNAEEALQHPFVANAEIDPELVDICRQLSELDEMDPGPDENSPEPGAGEEEATRSKVTPKRSSVSSRPEPDIKFTPPKLDSKNSFKKEDIKKEHHKKDPVHHTPPGKKHVSSQKGGTLLEVTRESPSKKDGVGKVDNKPRRPSDRDLVKEKQTPPSPSTPKKGDNKKEPKKDEVSEVKFERPPDKKRNQEG